MAKNALVLGADSRILLSVIRSLGRGGVQVHVGSDDPEHAVLQSRYLHQTHWLPPIQESDVAWKDALLDLMRGQRFDLVMPCSECEVLACHRHRAHLEQYGKVCVPHDQAHEVLFDKFKTTELARSLDVATPREMIVTDSQRQDETLRRFGLPVVLKPARTLDALRFRPLSKVRKAYRAEEFQRLLTGMLAEGPVAIQENCAGAGVGVELLMDAGRPLLAFQHRRVHEPMHGGPSSYRKSQALSPDLLAAAVKILAAVDYSGVAMVEFKVNEAEGTWVLLEVNARFWGSLPLALAAGADFPLALYQHMVEGLASFSNGYRPEVYCRNWSLDMEWQRQNIRADRSDPTLASRPLNAVFKDFCFNLLTGREHSDTFAWDDPWPGFAELTQLATRFGASLRRSLTWRNKAAQTAMPMADGAAAPRFSASQDQLWRGALR